jgi:hypothetical protein
MIQNLEGKSAPLPKIQGCLSVIEKQWKIIEKLNSLRDDNMLS